MTRKLAKCLGSTLRSLIHCIHIGLLVKRLIRLPVTQKNTGSIPVQVAIHCGVSSAVEPLVYTEKVRSSILLPRTITAHVGQLVESARLERVCWGFESLHGHQNLECLQQLNNNYWFDSSTPHHRYTMTTIDGLTSVKSLAVLNQR